MSEGQKQSQEGASNNESPRREVEDGLTTKIKDGSCDERGKDSFTEEDSEEESGQSGHYESESVRLSDRSGTLYLPVENYSRFLGILIHSNKIILFCCFL